MNGIANRKLDHIGLFTNDVDQTAKWYCDELGYEVFGDFSDNGFRCVFIRNRTGIAYELIQPPKDGGFACDGKLDHLSYVSGDIEADYAYCMAKNYKDTTNGIQNLPGFWKNGCRYFKVATSTGEEIEFCQIL